MTIFDARSSTLNKLRAGHIHAAGAVLLLALGAVVYALAYEPHARALVEAEAQRIAIQKAEDEQRANAELLQRALTELRDVRSGLADPGSDGVDPGLDAVERVRALAETASLTVHQVSEEGRAQEGPLQRTTIALRASGSFSDMVAWLDQIGRHLPGAVVDGFSVMRQPSEQSILTMQASLSVYAPQPAPSIGDGSERLTQAQEPDGSIR
ncbi:MAG: GspMb/PilO family protein [Phycisphaerales bacterium]